MAAGLKELRNRVQSVKSTQKITRAMKMVSAAKMRRAIDTFSHSEDYSSTLRRMVSKIASRYYTDKEMHKLLTDGSSNHHLLIVATSERGLCGAFNANIIKEVVAEIKKLQQENKKISILCVGRKGYEILTHRYKELVIKEFNSVVRKQIKFDNVTAIRDFLVENYMSDQFDQCKIFYSHYKNAITQEPKQRKLIPMEIDLTDNDDYLNPSNRDIKFIFEPSASILLDELLKEYLAVEIFNTLLENAASEHAARRTAMDNATNNAGELIGSLTLKLNRTRQAQITRELIEIISGAEAL